MSREKNKKNKKNLAGGKMSQLLEKKSITIDSPVKPSCTICGDSLNPKPSEKYQLRWENKNAGVCQNCVIHLRKQFKTYRNKTPIRYRRPELFLEDQDIALLQIEDLGTNYLAVLQQQKRLQKQ